MSEIKAPERVPAASMPASLVPGGTQLSDSIVTVSPTQVRRPWRTTARSAFQVIVALAVLFPILVQTAGLDPETLPWLLIPLGVAAALTRIMALPQVEEFLRTFLPFLAAAPSGAKSHRDEDGITDTMAAVAVIAVVVILLVIFVPWHR